MANIYNTNIVRKMFDYRILGNAILSFLQKGRLLHENVITPKDIANINKLAIDLFKSINDYILTKRYSIDKDYNSIKKASECVCKKKESYFNFLNREYMSMFGGDIEMIFPNKKTRKKEVQTIEPPTRAKRIEWLKAIIKQYNDELYKLEKEENESSRHE